jgi:hypothetical protein
MDPDAISGGRSIDGNSIYWEGIRKTATRTKRVEGTNQALVGGEQHGDAGVDLADSERDEHGRRLGRYYMWNSCSRFVVRGLPWKLWVLVDKVRSRKLQVGV